MEKKNEDFRKIVFLVELERCRGPLTRQQYCQWPKAILSLRPLTKMNQLYK